MPFCTVSHQPLPPPYYLCSCAHFLCLMLFCFCFLICMFCLLLVDRKKIIFNDCIQLIFNIVHKTCKHVQYLILFVFNGCTYVRTYIHTLILLTYMFYVCVLLLATAYVAFILYVSLFVCSSSDDTNNIYSFYSCTLLIK